MTNRYPKVAQLRTVEDFRSRCESLGISIPVDPKVLTAKESSPLGVPIQIGDCSVGNRFCIHPMEGWDANQDGSPSDLTFRRWRNFGLSGAKLIWGGEAAAVQLAGRANPRQLLATPSNATGLRELLSALIDAHQHEFGSIDDLLVGLQLTHSGRFSRPNSTQFEPHIAYHHPLLDEKFGINPDDKSIVWTDEDLERLIDSFIDAARTAQSVGFQFVDVKACHGYLLHEFLSARSRRGRFGGDFMGRTRLLRTIVERIRIECPQLMIGVRLSAYDFVPFVAGSERTGQPMRFDAPYTCGFGTEEASATEIDLAEPIRLIGELNSLGVAAINVTCGSPYYNPHIQRPAAFPPSDGYPPPEDPLVGVARLIDAARQCKLAFPELPMVGSGYSYLQDYLPHVAQAVVRSGWVDCVGLGRSVLSYPEMPADVLRTGQLQRKRICRSFSDCTTAPRNGIVSGCFPLDEHYKRMPEYAQVLAAKQKARSTNE